VVQQYVDVNCQCFAYFYAEFFSRNLTILFLLLCFKGKFSVQYAAYGWLRMQTDMTGFTDNAIT
jgi:hypothetical protein